jgi:hypothetical protein
MSMKGRRRWRREAAAEAQRPVQCTGTCQRVFGSRGAYDQAHDPGWPGVCLPVGAIESLLVDHRGTWYTRGSEPR